MKKFSSLLILAGLVSLFSVSSFAHPQDSDSVESLGVGASISLKVDLNYPATQTIKWFYNGKVISRWTVADISERVESSNNIYCHLELKSSSDIDRVILKGTQYTVLAIEVQDIHGSYTVASLRLDSPEADVDCTKRGTEITIGDLKYAMKGVFDIAPGPTMVVR